MMCGSLYAQVAQGPFQTHLILASSIVRNPAAGSASSIYHLLHKVGIRQLSDQGEGGGHIEPIEKHVNNEIYDIFYGSYKLS